MTRNTRSNISPKPLFKSFKHKVVATTAAICIGAASLTSGMVSAGDGMAELKKVLKSQIEMMTPEMQKKVNGLSTDTKMSLMAILAMHNRYSDQATLRQVMLEVLNDYQTMTMGIMTNSSEMAVDGAKRLANHRIPVGGLLPYLGFDNITDERLAVLDTFNTEVEGTANKIAAAAEKGDMATAASLLGTMSAGCVGCHEIFRPGNPGVSDLLR